MVKEATANGPFMNLLKMAWVQRIMSTGTMGLLEFQMWLGTWRWFNPQGRQDGYPKGSPRKCPEGNPPWAARVTKCILLLLNRSRIRWKTDQGYGERQCNMLKVSVSTTKDAYAITSLSYTSLGTKLGIDIFEFKGYKYLIFVALDYQ